MKTHAADLAGMRHDIHRHPELGFEEFRTSDLVAQRLREWGYEVGRGLGGTGVVGRMRRGAGGKSLGLRADMDALPIQEQTGLPYASRNAGIMHACGHDGHTAMLLGAARYLAEQGDFSGTLNLIFQPAEESLGGARRMIEEGLFKHYPCDAVFAMHNMPGTPQGRLVFREGATMASSDYATVTLTGTGGHGAMPHLAADPVVAAASVVMALQTLVSRNIDPRQMAIVTVGAIHAGKANNVIPHTAVLEISMRSLDRGVRALLKSRLHAIVHAQADSFGVAAAIDFRDGYPVLVNNAEETGFARRIGLGLAGPDNVVEQGDAITASEDFAFMLEERPGCYLFIGNGETGAPGGCQVHNPGYDFNDGNLALGAAYWACLAENYLD
ncbi:MAG: M20 aminoacylase family protein [Noviherbaspirillum sp.]